MEVKCIVLFSSTEISSLQSKAKIFSVLAWIGTTNHWQPNWTLRPSCLFESKPTEVNNDSGLRAIKDNIEQPAYNQIYYCLHGSRPFDLALKYYSIILFLFLFLCFASCPKSFPSSREHCPRRSSLGMSPNLHCSCQGQEHFDPKTNPAK